jgi:hypothetical protein
LLALNEIVENLNNRCVVASEGHHTGSGFRGEN